MKRVLLKPQREAANAVLAYQYEAPDAQGREEWGDGYYWWSDWHTDAYCKDNKDCWWEEGRGGCSLLSDGEDQWCG